MKAAGNHFLQNWATTLINLVYSLLLFYPVLLQEGPKLWEECKGVIYGGGGVDRFDHVLGVLRHLVNIVAGLVATTGIWAMIIAAFFPPAEIVVVPAYETISLGVIGADVALGLAEMGKAWYSATRDGISAKTRETYLSMFSSSAISTAITIILVILGAIASRLAKAFKAWRAGPGEAGESVKGTGEKPKESDPAGKQTQPGVLKDPPPEDIAASEPIEPKEGGGKVEVTKDGECVICASPCEKLEQLKEDYRDVLADLDEANDVARAKLDAAEKIDGKADPVGKAKAVADAVEELRKAKRKPPTGKKPAYGEPGAAEWRYQRYAAKKWAKGENPLPFEEWKSQHYDPAEKGGRPGRSGGPEQVKAKAELAKEGVQQVENVELGGRYPDGVRPNAAGGTDYFEVGKMNNNGLPEARERLKIADEIPALGPNDTVTFVDKNDISRRITYRPGDTIAK